jgi:hypothetical protein
MNNKKNNKMFLIISKNTGLPLNAYPKQSPSEWIAGTGIKQTV